MHLWNKSWKLKENWMIINGLGKYWLVFTDSYETFKCSLPSVAYDFKITIFCQWKFIKLWRIEDSNTFCNPWYYIRSNAQRKTSNAPCTLMTCLYHFVSNILVQHDDFQSLKPILATDFVRLHILWIQAAHQTFSTVLLPFSLSCLAVTTLVQLVARVLAVKALVVAVLHTPISECSDSTSTGPNHFTYPSTLHNVPHTSKKTEPYEKQKFH